MVLKDAAPTLISYKVFVVKFGKTIWKTKIKSTIESESKWKMNMVKAFNGMDTNRCL